MGNRLRGLEIFYGVFLVSIILLSSHALQNSSGFIGVGTLFGTDGNAANLININTGTGVGNIVGNTNGPNLEVFPSLAFDHTTGTMYGGAGQGIGALHTINTITGQANPVGVSNLGFAAIGGMDVNAAGVLYAAVNIAGDGGTGSDHLATINKNTGLTTIIGPFGICNGLTLPFPHLPSDGSGTCTNEGIEGIAFDSAGTLWGVHSFRGAAGAPGLYTINTNTGAANFVLPLLDVAGAPATGGFVSIQFACDGTLFGGTARAIQANDGGFLATINTNNGIYTLLPNQATSGPSLAGLAFGSQCPSAVGGDIIPLDITMVLVAGAQYTAAWMIPAIVSGIGIGIVIARKF